MATLSIIFDTASALTVGYKPFHLTVTKHYPQLVHTLCTPTSQPFPPLYLGGVIYLENEQSNSHVLLDSIIIYHTPYLFHGNPTTFAVALGDNIAANTILGNSFITSTGSIFDPSLKTITSLALNQTWEVIFHPPSHHKPNVISLGDPSSALFSNPQNNPEFKLDNLLFIYSIFIQSFPLYISPFYTL